MNGVAAVPARGPRSASPSSSRQSTRSAEASYCLTRESSHRLTTTFYLRFTENGKRATQPLGTVLSDAFTALRNKQIAREFAKHGLDVSVLTGSGRPTIADAVAQFVKNQTALDTAASTLYVYKRAAERTDGGGYD
jgi:hypothetical protein